MFKRTKPPAIIDPEAHARARTGKLFRTVRTSGSWIPYGTFHRTGEFEHTDSGYRRHCGPTAMVNLLSTAEARYPLPGRTPDPPLRAFRRIASIGLMKHYYINADILGLIGGTFNAALPSYLRKVLRGAGRTDLRVTRSRPAWRRFLTDAIDRGSMLFVVLVWHPLYGNHHVIAYGYRYLAANDGTRRLYLLIADGWSGEARWLFAEDLRMSYVLEIEHKC